jgi:SAM-dependent methyltransferase
LRTGSIAKCHKENHKQYGALQLHNLKITQIRIACKAYISYLCCMVKEFWNERYSTPEYVYGEAPNTFFAEQLQQLKPGHIILPCDGEGRNGVYAATLGWTVTAFDQSEEGRNKALQLAQKKGVTIEYDIADVMDAEYPSGSADVVALVYAHLPPAPRAALLAKAVRWLKPRGKLILEAYNPAQLNNSTGGPKDVDMLYTEEIIRLAFSELHTEMLQCLRLHLEEGAFHSGMSDIIRYIGTK